MVEDMFGLVPKTVEASSTCIGNGSKGFSRSNYKQGVINFNFELQMNRNQLLLLFAFWFSKSFVAALNCRTTKTDVH